MSVSQYHECCQYRKSMSIPWVFAKTMSPCLYHESMSIPWVHVYTISLFLYHESMSIPWVFVKSMLTCLYMRNTVFRYTEIQITRIKKYKLQNYRNTTCRFTEIQRAGPSENGWGRDISNRGTMDLCPKDALWYKPMKNIKCSIFVQEVHTFFCRLKQT